VIQTASHFLAAIHTISVCTPPCASLDCGPLLADDLFPKGWGRGIKVPNMPKRVNVLESILTTLFNYTDT
jgi:hypothetical protein